jgi:hypothetical protein
MKKTWEFTRNYSMVFRYIECFFYILVSCTDTWTYMAMIYSMYTNAGLITFFYPLTVFGYALLNETRPNHKFWRMVMTYSICLLIIKFTCSIQIIQEFMVKEPIKYYLNLTSSGLVTYK